MGKQFSELADKHIEFINKQKIYFVATAAEVGKVNLSPKGGDSLKVISPTQIAWLNLTGSGNESAAHVLQNPRMTVMWCAFEGSPLILRTYGKAKVLHSGDAEWAKYTALFPDSVANRQIFLLEIEMVQASCGMSVPLYTYDSDRNDLANWSERQGADGLEKYWLKNNQTSLDGFETEIAQRAKLSAD